MQRKKRICLDLICDEALLLAKAFSELASGGEVEVVGFAMGQRWNEASSELIDVRRFLLLPAERVKDELDRLAHDYKDFDPASFLVADRFLGQLYSRDMQVRFLVSLFSFFEDIVRSCHIDFFVTTGVAYAYNLVALAVCRKYRINHYSLYGTRQSTPMFTYSSGNGARWDLFDKAYASSLEELDVLGEQRFSVEVAKLDDFRNYNVAPSYMSFARQKGGIRFVFIKEFLRRCKYWYLDRWGKSKEDYLTRHPLWYVRRDFGRIINRLYLNSKCIFDHSNKNEKYYIYPLHLQPEASTLIFAPEYVNQVELIRNIARVLPFGSLLYVKEHPAAYGRHSDGFYKELRKLHNVKLISPRESGRDLLTSSAGVIVLSGTMGWEAMLLGAPVFVLGDVFYDCIRGINKVAGYGGLRSAFYAPQVVERKSILAALKAITSCAAEGVFDVAKLDSRAVVLSNANVRAVGLGLRRFIFENN